jgi:hypothetical protein
MQNEGSLAAVKSERSRIENLINEFDKKEKELRKTGERFLGDIGRAGSTSASKLVGSGNYQAAFIVGAATLLVQGVGYLYNRKEQKGLEQERKQFAIDNRAMLEEIGTRLKRETVSAVAFLDGQEEKTLLNLTPQTFLHYCTILIAMINYQHSVCNLLNRQMVFSEYYGKLSEWSETPTDASLTVSPVNVDGWMQGRLKSAEQATARSTSLIYNFSMQGHLLLFFEADSPSPLEAYRKKAEVLFENELKRAQLPEQAALAANAKIILGNSELKRVIEKKEEKIQKAIRFKQRLPLIIGALVAVAAIAVGILVCIGATLVSVFNKLFG